MCAEERREERREEREGGDLSARFWAVVPGRQLVDIFKP